MELREALRMLRSEVGLTQIEFAAAVYVSFSTVNRWENKGMRPNKMQSKAILELARRKRVSAACLEALTCNLMASRADDKDERTRRQMASRQLKLEQWDLLTAEQFRKTMDSLCMAIMGLRFYNSNPESCDIFYENSFFLRILGYPPEEYENCVRQDPYFMIVPEHRQLMHRRLRALLTHRVAPEDFSVSVRAVRKDGGILWLDFRAASLTEYSYGQELFTSCCDVTRQVETERRYSEEVLLRNATMKLVFSSLHCDLTDNTVTRRDRLAATLGREYEGESIDQLFGHMADAAPEGSEKARFQACFRRDALLEAFRQGTCYGNVVLYNQTLNRWFRNEYLLLENPANGHINALIFIFDIQQTVLAEKMLGVFFDLFCEYVGVIDNETEQIESYYYAAQVFQEQIAGKRHYPTLCREKLARYGCDDSSAAAAEAMSLATVRAGLAHNKFYSMLLHLRDADGKLLVKGVVYTYLDETRDAIIMAQLAQKVPDWIGQAQADSGGGEARPERL